MVTPRSIETWPSSGASSPVIRRKTVDLPAPLGPTSPTFSPRWMAAAASTKRIWRPCCLLIWSSRIMAGGVSGNRPLTHRRRRGSTGGAGLSAREIRSRVQRIESPAVEEAVAPHSDRARRASPGATPRRGCPRSSDRRRGPRRRRRVPPGDRDRGGTPARAAASRSIGAVELAPAQHLRQQPHGVRGPREVRGVAMEDVEIRDRVAAVAACRRRRGR